MNRGINSEIMRLVEDVRAAFSDVPHPGNNITDTQYPWDEGIGDYFRGTTQEGHDVEKLRLYKAALSYFVPEAYRYYLPAFVTAVLMDPQEADTIYDSLIVDFTGMERARRIIESLSPTQREVMVRFFEYCLQREGESSSVFSIARAIELLK